MFVSRFQLGVSMPLPFLPYGRQYITEDDENAVLEALRSPFLTTGPKVAEFEAAFANYVEAKHAVAVSNGTAALHLACLALDIKTGDGVLTPSMSFAASTNGAAYCGATIEFIDCDPETGLITPALFVEAADRAVAKGIEIKAAVIVHINGEHADMAALSAEATKRDIHLIEDACHALGTSFQDDNGLSCKVGACRYSTFATFSTHPVKTITTGEGGVITTKNAAFAKKLRDLRSHGLERNSDFFMHPDRAFDGKGNPNPWYYEIQSLGYNYRLTDIACALGLSQLLRMPDIAQKRRVLTDLYDQLFAKSDLPLSTIPHADNSESVRHLYPILIDFEALGFEKSSFVHHLREIGVGTQVHYVPTHFHPLYSEHGNQDELTGSEAYYRKVLSLPLYPELTTEDIERVVSSVGESISALSA